MPSAQILPEAALSLFYTNELERNTQHWTNQITENASLSCDVL